MREVQLAAVFVRWTGSEPTGSEPAEELLRQEQNN